MPITFTGEGIPKIGDTATAVSLGFSGRSIRIYVACSECGKERWSRYKDQHNSCLDCTAKGNSVRQGDKHPKWKGGLKRTKGYTYVLIDKSDPMAVMATKRYKDKVIIAEHRLIVARRIGRPLLINEVVHHINGIKNDNRSENLQLLDEHKHHPMLVPQMLQSRLQSLEARATALESENVLLRSILQEVRDSNPDGFSNLRCYNTLGDLLDKQVEGIVQSLSNKGNEHESA